MHLGRSSVVPQLWNGRFRAKKWLTRPMLFLAGCMLALVTLRSMPVINANWPVTPCSRALMPVVLLLITVCAWPGLASVMCATLC